jgi:hypothetical protein
MSYRELWVFLQHLPQDSWTQTVIRDEQFTELVHPATEQAERKFGPWRLDNYQLAAVVTLGRLQGQDWKYPEPVPRPGLERSSRRQPEWAVAYLNKLRATG